MTQFLPPNLLALFAPREPLPYLPPAVKLPHEKESQPYTGLASFVYQFENPKDTPPPTRVETRDEKKERKRKERAEQIAYKLEQDLALWDPANDVNIYGDPYKTLFVARINYDSSESKLRREFDVYGPVKKVHLIMNRVSAAYKHADGKKIDGRRILVDVERGRTVKGWRPRRLGGGLGNTRKGGSDVNTKYSGRDDFVGRDRAVPDDRKSLEVHSLRDDRPPRSPERFRRSTRSRERSREKRRNRSRSRDRRRRSRERRRSPEREIKKEPVDENEVPQPEADEGSKKRRRSRSRERRRSRSRDRKRGRRSRSRERRGSKPRDRNRGEKDGGEAQGGLEPNGGSGVFIKQEVDDKDYEGAYDASGDQYQNYDNTTFQGGAEFPNYEEA